MNEDIKNSEKISICAICGIPFIPRIISSSKVEFVDNLCERCAKDLKEAALIVCKTCRRPIGRIQAKKLECGYIVKPGEILHVSECCNCNKDCISSELIEVETWKQNIRENKIYIKL
jgi:hypothetical protein